VIFIPVSLLVLALLSYVVGVAEGSTLLDYLSIVASIVAFVLVVVLGRFGRSRTKGSTELSARVLPGRPDRRDRRALNPDLSSGYGQARTDDGFGVDDALAGVATDPTPTSAYGIGGQARPEGASRIRLAPYEPDLPASSPLALLGERSAPRDLGAEPSSGPPTEAVTPARQPWDRPRIFDRAVEEESLRDIEGPASISQSASEQPALVEEWADFPIAEYDDLRIDEILPLLPELEADEIEVVRTREQAGANRAFILRRLDLLEERLTAPDVESIAAVGHPPAPMPLRPTRSYGPPTQVPITNPPPLAPRPRITSPPPLAPRPRIANPLPSAASPLLPPALRRPPAQPRTYGPSDPSDGPAFSEGGYAPLPNREVVAQVSALDNRASFPIEGYDQLRVIDILAAISDLDADEVEAVRRYEVAGACRAPILRQIELLSSFRNTAAVTPAGPAPSQRRAPRPWGSKD
jgi:hypothetical protein